MRGSLPAYTEQYCRRAFFEETLGRLVPASEWTDAPSTWWTDPSEMEDSPEYEPNPGRRWVSGSDAVEGRLWGGCRAIIEWQLAVDRYLPQPEYLDGNVLCLETAETIPEPEDVGATLMCLGERGRLERFAGVVVGRSPTRSFLKEPPRTEREAYRRRLYEIDWGHTTPIAPIPLGGQIRLEPDSETVRCV